MRADPASDQLARRAALARVNKSAFVLKPAVDAAQRVLAREATTLMLAEQFDTLLASLDEPDEAPTLARAARRTRRAA